MQHGSDPAVDSGEAAIDGRGEFIRSANEFRMGAERAANIGKAAPLALPA